MICATFTGVRLRTSVVSIAEWLVMRTLIAIGMSLIVSLSATAQSSETPDAQSGRVMGTVTDVNGDALVGATVTMMATDSGDRLSAQTDENGSFEINGLKSSVPYHLVVKGGGFEDWTSPIIVLAPDEFKLIGEIPLRL